MMKYRKICACLLLTAGVLLLAACASRGIRGQSPFVQVNGLILTEQSLSLDLGLRNVNSEPILIEHIEFSILLDNTSLAIYNAASQASIIANGTENLRFELAVSNEGAALLNELEQGNRSNLEYSFDGVLIANENANMKVMQKGHIYPVPGRPGHFR
jgi:LEA14-like dessication related protein